jgi:NADPH:quinone reductase
MKAAQLKDYGPADNFKITDVPKPQPGPEDVLIKVNYAGLRWGDIMGRNGIPVKAAKPPFVPGQEAAGVIEAVGERVTKFKVGDRVTALPYGGAYAEYLSMPASERVTKVPDSVPLHTALVYRVNMPAVYFLIYEWAKVQEGESVLVHAAAGGVGMLVVDVLKQDFKNVKVIGLTSSEDKVKTVLEHGADHAINYKTHDYVAEVEKLVGAKPRGFAPGAPPAGVHVVLNGVAGGTLQKDRFVIRPLGRWVLYGTPGGIEPLNVFAHAYESIAIMPFSIIPFMGTPMYAKAQAYTEDWMKNKKLTAPTIHPLEEVADVQRAMEQGKTQGKIVFSIAPE